MKHTAPSLKRLAFSLGITTEQAKIVRALIRREIRTDDPRFIGTLKWIASCYSRPSFIERLMECINETIRGHGVEALGDNMQPVALYINTGDAYSPTLLYSYKSSTVRLTTWGDFAEANNL